MFTLILNILQLKNDPKHFTSVKEDVLISLKEEAKKCYQAEVANYNTSNFLYKLFINVNILKSFKYFFRKVEKQLEL